MGQSQRKSLEILKETIRRKRSSMGLPEEGPVRSETLLEAFRKKPPIEELVRYVHEQLGEDCPSFDRHRKPR